MYCRFLTLSLLSILALSSALAQQSTRAPGTEHLRRHISYLASDALEGRRTGTQGAVAAANYVAKEFKRIGLKPVPSEVSLSRAPGAVGHYDTYLQTFPYVAGVDLGKNNLLTSDLAESATLRVGEDWMPLGMSSNGSINATTVFLGFGIAAAEANHNDYATVNATNKVVVVLPGTPDADNPHGQFARYADVRWKAIAARNAGAKALIVIARESNFKVDRLSRLRYDNSAGDAGLPVAVISQQSIQRILPGVTLAELETAARSKDFAAVNKVPIKVLLRTDLIRREVPALNVIGVLPGSDPVLKNEAIVIGAHYDHLGRGGEGSLALTEGEIHHGADDNASGTAGVLELATIFASQNPKPKRTIVFIAFGGEEEGLLGSNYYVNHPAFPLANTVAMINMDMIGRMKNRSLIIGGVGTAKEWRSMIDNANLLQSVTVTAHGSRTANRNMPLVVSANGQTIVSSDSARKFILTINEDGLGPSDHSSFYLKKIPVLFFWTGTHADYHKPSDTPDKINYEDEAQILSFAKRIIDEIDDSDKRPEYMATKTESTGRAIGFRVYLGTIPNYADSSDGLLLDGVRDRSPAAKAGLKAGDKIVKLAGRDVRNVYDYTYALGEMKAGEDYEIEVLRGSERLTLQITPAARR